MSEEVEQLLDAVRRKSAKLADAEQRLTGRLRWGVAMIQAKSEASTKRQVFMWWRCGGLGGWVVRQTGGEWRCMELAALMGRWGSKCLS